MYLVVHADALFYNLFLTQIQPKMKRVGFNVMKANINNTLVSSLKQKKTRYDVWDTKLSGFHVRVNTNGRKFYRCWCKGGKVITIGSAELLTPAAAREKAKTILGDVAKGVNPGFSDSRDKSLTLREFIESKYGDWRLTNRKRGEEDVEQIRRRFYDDFGDKRLDNISVLDVESWRTKRLKAHIKPVTINRNLSLLKSLLNKAVEWDVIQQNPLDKLKLSKIDNIRIRYLTPDEELRLRKAVDERDKFLQAKRISANKWREERGYPLLPEFCGDHIKPMVLLSLNTGLRKGEVLALTWESINIEQALLTVVSASAKSGKARHIPLNKEAMHVLKDWRRNTGSSGLVFPNKDGKRMLDIKTAWAHLLRSAQIGHFRWHDLRHHFASKLVMAGADLNSVRELLGHADLKMTLRYAHLAPEHKAKVVALLDES